MAVKKMVALRQFRFAGRTFKPGDEFRWQQLGCGARKMMRLTGARFIGDVPPDLPAPAPEPVSEEDDDAPVADIVHAGGGWFDVNISGIVTRIQGRASAEEFAIEQGATVPE